MDAVRCSLDEGEVLLDHLLDKGIGLAHDCGGALACASCRVIVHKGLEQLEAASEDELDMLDRAGASGIGARLACQVRGAAGIVVEVPDIAKPAPSVISPLSITARAAHYFAGQLHNHPGAVAVRLAVQSAGCSGFSYRVDPAHAIGEGDAVFEAGGVRVIVDPASLPFLQGSTVDVAQEGLSRRLRFDNPNARQSCGCGESFGV